ncbi:MAG: NAD(P)/FAD-dependent oxidoreductase [Pseudomonadota bacterium]
MPQDIHKLGKTPGTRRIVIIGAGIGGLMLATRLARKYRRNVAVEVYLVDRAPVHVWKPMLHTFASGTSHSNVEGIPLIAQAKSAGFRFVPGAFCALNTDAKSIKIEISDLPNQPTLNAELYYDVLVFAVGSQANDFDVSGVREHCEFIDTLWNAERLNATLRSVLAHAVITNTPMTIAIVGGGATGVEFAADVATLRDIGSSYGAANLNEILNVTLLNSSTRVLSAFSEDVSRQVTEKLMEAGVTVRNDARVSRVDAESFHLTDGESIRAELRVWAAGIASPKELKSGTNLALSKTGQIQVDEYLTTSHPDIFALGDCAACPNSEMPDRLLPPTGQVARQQADYLYKSIPARMERVSIRPFKFNDMGSLVSLSHYGAFGELTSKGYMPSIALKGFVAKQAHRLFYRMHQFGLYGAFGGTVLYLRDGLNRLVKPKIRLD